MSTVFKEYSIYYQPLEGQWVASAYLDGRFFDLGLHDSEGEAELAVSETFPREWGAEFVRF